jgi:dTDP-4-dehydrorhamnose reductase
MSGKERPDTESPSPGKKIWLIGDKGMLGAELSRCFLTRGFACIGTDREVDITDPAALETFATEQAGAIAVIVNCAAYTAVDRAEDNADFCQRLNTEGPANIAKTAKKIGAKLIHISTDYVFDGTGICEGGAGPRPYRENDATNPIGVYGLTKRDGEDALMANNPASWILRTAWLYGKYGNNFVHTMLKLMAERDSVSVVDDQRGSPTWAYDLSAVVADIIRAWQWGRQIPYGIYHYTNEGSITWFDFAREIYEQGRSLGLLTRECSVKPCASSEFPARVKRPAYSVLNKTKIRAALGVDIPTWDESLIKYLRLSAKEQGLQKSTADADIRWKQRFDNYQKSMDHLTAIVKLYNSPGFSEIEQAACIKFFETAFELAWKVMKDYLSEKGIAGIIGSKDAIRHAFNNGIIDEGELWLQMVDSRNETVHTYDESAAKDLALKIAGRYYDKLRCFAARMSSFM